MFIAYKSHLDVNFVCYCKFTTTIFIHSTLFIGADLAGICWIFFFFGQTWGCNNHYLCISSVFADIFILGAKFPISFLPLSLFSSYILSLQYIYYSFILLLNTFKRILHFHQLSLSSSIYSSFEFFNQQSSFKITFSCCSLKLLYKFLHLLWFLFYLL